MSFRDLGLFVDWHQRNSPLAEKIQLESDQLHSVLCCNYINHNQSQIALVTFMGRGLLKAFSSSMEAYSRRLFEGWQFRGFTVFVL